MVGKFAGRFWTGVKWFLRERIVYGCLVDEFVVQQRITA
jgi:hypothetical protein